jgi:hypothetical protein
MTRYVSRTVDFGTLLQQRAGAATVVKLMMACNDLQTSNESLEIWRELESRDSARRHGACMYFVRLQLAHLYEALDVVEAMQRSAALMAILRSCDAATQQSFDFVCQFVRGGTQRSRMELLAGRMRNNITFHYEQSETLIGRAIVERGSRPGGNTSRVTRGSRREHWYFKVADDVIDDIVTRQFWRVPSTPSTGRDVDVLLMEAHEIAMRFVDFCGEFIWRYTD